MTRVARTAGAGSAEAVMPATAIVRAGLAETVPMAAKAGLDVGAKAVVETVSVAEMEYATAGAATPVVEKVTGAMGIVAGVVAACATTVPTHAVKASARTAWRRRSRSPICRRAWKSPTWILLCCRI